MRVISPKALRTFWNEWPDSEAPLRLWYAATIAAQWRNFMQVRTTFAAADTVKVASGNTVTVFDIGGNKYRLITAIYYNTGCVYALLVLTRKQYDKQTWKDRL